MHGPTCVDAIVLENLCVTREVMGVFNPTGNVPILVGGVSLELGLLAVAGWRPVVKQVRCPS